MLPVVFPTEPLVNVKPPPDDLLDDQPHPSPRRPPISSKASRVFGRDDNEAAVDRIIAQSECRVLPRVWNEGPA